MNSTVSKQGEEKKQNYTVLHTGDFRFKPSMLEYFRDPSKPDEEAYIQIDRLYLDNTFATSAEEFPSQEEAFD